MNSRRPRRFKITAARINHNRTHQISSITLFVHRLMHRCSAVVGRERCFFETLKTILVQAQSQVNALDEIDKYLYYCYSSTVASRKSAVLLSIVRLGLVVLLSSCYRSTLFPPLFLLRNPRTTRREVPLKRTKNTEPPPSPPPPPLPIKNGRFPSHLRKNSMQIKDRGSCVLKQCCSHPSGSLGYQLRQIEALG